MATFNQLALMLLSASLMSACANQEHHDQLASTVSSSQAIVEGVPGGVFTDIEQIQATVSAIDYDKRTVTLKDEAGNQQTIKAVPQMVNFPQLKVGDRVTASIVREQVVHLREPGEAVRDGAAGILATAPEGSKPGMLMADTLELTAVVKSIDQVQRIATLEFADGSQKTVRIRPDIQLKTEYLNRQVVIQITSAVAISVTTE